MSKRYEGFWIPAHDRACRRGEPMQDLDMAKYTRGLSWARARRDSNPNAHKFRVHDPFLLTGEPDNEKD